MTRKPASNRKAKRRTGALLALDTWLLPLVLLVVGIAGRQALDTEQQKNILTIGCIVPIPLYLMFVMWIRYRR